MKYRLFFSAMFLLAAYPVFAQPSLLKMKTNLSNPNNAQVKGSQMTIDKPTQASVLFSAISSLNDEQEEAWLKDQLNLRQGIDALPEEGKPTVTGDLKVKNVHQYFKDIKVEHGVIKTTVQNSKVTMMQMEFYSVPDTFKTTPDLTEAEALQKAIQFTGAIKYIWDDATESDSAHRRPGGELVIIQTYLEEGQLCLAYKFDIYAIKPLSRAYVYVDAQTGRIVLEDNIIKHTNQTGVADTHYSGVQQIITDDNSGVQGKPYWLDQQHNGHEIVTYGFNHQIPGEPGNMLYKWVDADNYWSAAEFNNAAQDDGALDVHFNMQIIDDYWKQVHNRNSWDNQNSKIINFVHVNEYEEIGGTGYNLPMDNAYWNGAAMFYGDGRNGAYLPPGAAGPQFNSVTSLDVSAHELGHAVCQTTAALVYRWESGALNEGFSDIWAACVENFGVQNNPSIAPNKSTWKIGEEITINYQFGLRDMSDPDSHGHPSTFKGPHWIPAEYPVCRVPDSHNNDNCGVHTNSNVLNKWFYLITQGGSGINTRGTYYTVFGIGFTASQKIAYLTELNLPPNSSFATARTVSVNATTTLFGAGSTEVNSVKDAWKAVSVDSSIYDMSNTPVFATNNFISIGVGLSGNVWAGTAYNGLYIFNEATAWVKRPEIPNVRINDIKADNSGGIWIAQSGTGTSAAIAGGVNYISDPNSSNSSFYTVSTQTQIPSRNARCIYVDKTQLNDGSNPKVWVATQSYLLSGSSTSGKLGQGLYANYQQFHGVSDSLNVGSGTAGISTVGGGRSEVWGFAQANYGGNQILSYNATTNAFIRSYDHNSVPLIPSGFVARAIFFDAQKRAWVGLANGGVMVQDEHQVWHTINFSTLFPVGTSVNFNAIAGDPYGDVYIGTTAGLVFFDHGVGESTRLDSAVYYHRYTDTNGLPSKNINAIAYDTSRFKLLIATDNGIVFWDPPCLGTSCDIVRTNLGTQASSNGPGNWSNPAIWSNGKIPDSATYVTLMHPVTVDVDARCRSIVIQPGGGAVHVNTGVNLTIYELHQPPMPVGVRRRR